MSDPHEESTAILDAPQAGDSVETPSIELTQLEAEAREAATDHAPNSARERLSTLSEGRLRRQIEFLLEIDRLKNVLRRTVLTDKSRIENSAEHSWHIAMMAMVLAEWSNQAIDVMRVVKMLLIHDIVEIDAGDTFCYDQKANLDKADRERRAADRIFGLLPADQRGELDALWCEFELRQTAEARFANAVDRLQPMLHNYLTEGHSWRLHGIARGQVDERNRPISEGAEELWALAQRFLDDASDNGWFAPSEPMTQAARAVASKDE